VLKKETSPSEENKHIHDLVRVNLQACSQCGHFFVTTYERTESGNLVLKEFELDLKVKSSRIRSYQSPDDQDVPRETRSGDRKKILEETCW
jgi:hypothetical protein